MEEARKDCVLLSQQYAYSGHIIEKLNQGWTIIQKGRSIAECDTLAQACDLIDDYWDAFMADVKEENDE